MKPHFETPLNIQVVFKFPAQTFADRFQTNNRAFFNILLLKKLIFITNLIILHPKVMISRIQTIGLKCVD